MKAIDILLSLQNRELQISKAFDGAIHVSYYCADVKDGFFLVSAYGVGGSIDDACEDYLNKIRGKRFCKS